MGSLQGTLVFLILLQVLNITATKDEEWKTASATYTKETDGSIITGTFLALSHRFTKV